MTTPTIPTIPTAQPASKTWTPLTVHPGPGEPWPGPYAELTGAQRPSTLQPYERMYLCDPGDGATTTYAVVGLYPRDNALVEGLMYTVTGHETDATGTATGTVADSHELTIRDIALATGQVTLTDEYDKVARMVCDRVLARSRAVAHLTTARRAGMVPAPQSLQAIKQAAVAAAATSNAKVTP